MPETPQPIVSHTPPSPSTPAAVASHTPGAAGTPAATVVHTPEAAATPAATVTHSPGSAGTPAVVVSHSPGAAGTPGAVVSHTPGAAGTPAATVTHSPGSAGTPGAVVSHTPGEADTPEPIAGVTPPPPPPTGAPVNAVLPVITVTGGFGEPKTCEVDTGTWTGAEPITYTYQWRADGVDIPTATANTYGLWEFGPMAGGLTPPWDLDCVVTATNGDGEASATTLVYDVDSAPISPL